jgi:hypothetical protein
MLPIELKKIQKTEEEWDQMITFIPEPDIRSGCDFFGDICPYCDCCMDSIQWIELYKDDELIAVRDLEDEAYTECSMCGYTL